MVANEPLCGLGEPTELLQQTGAGSRMAADDSDLDVVERLRLLENAVRHRQLADVVDEAADGERTQPARRQAEELSDLDRQQCDAPRVLFRVCVLLRQAP